VLENALEGALKVEEGTASTELEAAVKRLFDALEQVEGRAPDDEVDGLDAVDAFLTNTVQSHLQLGFLLLGIRLQVRFEALRNLALELVGALRNFALAAKLGLSLHPIEHVLVVRFVRVLPLLILLTDVVGVPASNHLDPAAAELDLAACIVGSYLALFPISVQRRVPAMQFVFKLNRVLHALNDESQVQSLRALRQNFVEVQLGDATKLLCEQLRHLPLLGEDDERRRRP